MATQEQKTNTETTEGSTATGKKRFSLSKRNLIGAVIAAVLLLGAGGIYYCIQNRATTESNTGFPKQEVEMEQLSFEDLQNKVNQLELSKQYDDARALVRHQDYYEKNQDAQWLYVALCINQGENKEALQALRNMEAAFGPSSGLYVGIAEQAEKMNDTKTAIEYYEKAVRFIKQDETNPVRESEAKQYQAKLDELKNQ